VTKGMEEFLYVFELNREDDGYKIFSELKSKMPKIAQHLLLSRVYLVDWNFDEELKYLFLVVKCYSGDEEEKGVLLRELLEKFLGKLSIKKKKKISSTKRVILNGRKRLLASLAVKMIKERTNEITEKLAERGLKLAKTDLALSLLFFSYLSGSFSEKLSELYMYFYPNFLEDYKIEDIELCFQELLKKNLVVSEGGKFVLSEKGAMAVRVIHDMLKAEQRRAIEENSFLKSFTDVNATLEKIIRRDGRFENFRLERILASVIKCGIKEDVAFGILNNLVAMFKSLKNLCREDVVEVVKLALDQVDRSGVFSSKFEFYVNTSSHLLIVDREGKPRLVSVAEIKRLLLERWFRSKFRISERVLDGLAFKVFEDLRFIYSSASPLISFARDSRAVAQISEEFIEILVDKEVEIQLPHYYRIARCANPMTRAWEVITELADESRKLLEEALIEEYLTRKCVLFNAAAYSLVSALLLLLLRVPSVVHVSNCGLLRTAVKSWRRGGEALVEKLSEDFLNRAVAFAKAALKIYYLSLSQEIEESEKITEYIRSSCRLGLKICEFIAKISPCSR